MKKTLLLLILPALLASCASIINNPSYKLAIRSNADNASVKVYDSIYPLPAKVTVKRSKDSLALTLLSETVTKDYKVKATDEAITVAGNIAALGIFSPVAIYVDRKNEKGYYYGRSLFLDINDTVALSRSERLGQPLRKGRVALSLSIPYINFFTLQPEGRGIKSNAGFLGLAGGLEYYYNDDRFLKLNAAGAINFIAPVPVPVLGDHEAMSAITLSLTHNHRWGRFSMGYGPSWQQTSWKYNTDDNGIPDEPARRSRAFGLVANGYYQLGKSFHMGVTYSPSFYSLHPNKEWLYQHVISIDLMWKIPLWK